MARVNIASDIPESLRDADELLMRFGRWAMHRRRQHHCGSAEGRYVAERGEALQARREAREVLMGAEEAMACQRALARVPDRERIVLEVLYVPKHIGERFVPPEAQFRVLRIPPRLSQVRHLSGLRMFDNLLMVVRSAHLTAGAEIRQP